MNIVAGALPISDEAPKGMPLHKPSLHRKEGSLQSNLSFRLMALGFRLRDRFHPPIRILGEAGIHAGMTIIDFGCGPGGFTLAAARLVGPKGLVYAVDLHPLAVASVRKAAQKSCFKNIRTILGESMMEIPGGTADMLLLYDVLHGLSETGSHLAEQHRVLKPKGVLSVMDHHLEEATLLSRVGADGRFRLIHRSRRTFEFQKVERTGVTA